MTSHPKSQSFFQTILTPINSNDSEATKAFWADLERITERFVSPIAWLAIIPCIMFVLVTLFAPSAPYTGIILWTNCIATVIYLPVILRRRLNIKQPAYRFIIYTLVINVFIASLVNIVSNELLIHLMMLLFTNVFLAVSPIPSRATRVMYLLNITSALVVFFLADRSGTSLQQDFFTLFLIFGSSVLGAVYHSFYLNQRWQVFSAQREIAELNQSLTVRSADLERANGRLQSQNAELDAFAHTVAHDLKNPLGAVMGYAEMLHEEASEEAEPNPELLDLSSKLIELSHKSANIINELLLLSSVRREAIEMRPLDMNNIVNGALQRLALPISEIAPEITIPESWPIALGHAPWVEEVWANYISNGLKYGGRPCQITLGADQLANGDIRFWIQDNGAGLSPEQQAQLFTEFTRLPETRAQGHGLGLSIVQRIADKLGGSVGVTSELGKGSRFHFTLPAKSDL